MPLHDEVDRLDADLIPQQPKESVIDDAAMPPRFQMHLSTLLVEVFVIGVLLFLNLRDVIKNYPEPLHYYWFGWPIDFTRLDVLNLLNGSKLWVIVAPGVDLMVTIVLLVAAFCFCEHFESKRDCRLQSHNNSSH